MTAAQAYIEAATDPVERLWRIIESYPGTGRAEAALWCIRRREARQAAQYSNHVAQSAFDAFAAYRATVAL
jgi:hypothetical protein